MNNLEEAKELVRIYHKIAGDSFHRGICLIRMDNLKAKIEAEWCGSGFQLTKNQTCACGYKLLNGDVWPCPDCHQALKELNEILK